MSACPASPPTRAVASGGRRGRALEAPLLLLLALGGLLASPAGAEEPVPPPPEFGRATGAWTAESAAGVVALVPERGTLHLSLLSPSVGGTYRRAQAQRTLQTYFRAIEGVRLKDVTPRDQRDAEDRKVRIYDYTYRPVGRDPVTTRLQITLKRAGEAGWDLEAVREMPRPRR